jgi:hypothetical protein
MPNPVVSTNFISLFEKGALSATIWQQSAPADYVFSKIYSLTFFSLPDKLDVR